MSIEPSNYELDIYATETLKINSKGHLEIGGCDAVAP